MIRFFSAKIVVVSFLAFGAVVSSCSADKGKNKVNVNRESTSGSTSSKEPSSDDVTIKIDETPDNPEEVDSSVQVESPCKGSETSSAACQVANGNGSESLICISKKFVSDGNGCLVETCEEAKGYAKVGNACVKTDCNAGTPPETCSIAAGSGAGTFDRKCSDGKWVSSNICILDQCKNQLFKLSTASNSCVRKALVLTLSGTRGGGPTAAFESYQSVFFAISSAGGGSEAPELCIAGAAEVNGCIDSSPNWKSVAADGAYTYSSGTWDLTTPFAPYSVLPATYKILARNPGSPGSTVSLQGTVKSPPSPVPTVASAQNTAGNMLNISNNGEIWIRLENVGPAIGNASVCIDANDAVCDQEAGFKSLPDPADAKWFYVVDANSAVGMHGAWFHKYDPGTVSPGQYRVFVRNNVTGVTSSTMVNVLE
jgi:hypothetical protein